MPAPRIFISYRRDDCAGHAGRVCDRLEQVFGSEFVFRDVEDIAAGDDFVDTLHAQVDQCEVLLALIGPRWLVAADAQGRRRLDKEHDWVRREIARGLDRQIRVIPVLLQGAKLPDAAELPEELAPLLRRQAVELRDTQFERDTELLVSLLAPGYRRLRRYRFVIAALLVAMVGIGAYAYHAHRERERIEQQQLAEQAARAQSPEAALEWLRANRYNRTAAVLMQMIRDGNDIAVQYLLRSGLDPNDTAPDDVSALRAAVAKGNTRTVELLLAHKADISGALGTAISLDQDEIAALLLTRELPAAEIQSALANAAQRGRVDMLERLVARGARVEEDRGEALRQAIANAQVEALAWLLQHGAVPASATRLDNLTALHEAASYNTGAEGPALAESMTVLLLDAGQDPNARATDLTRPYPTPLLLAIHAGNASTALRLLERGADPQARGQDREESTALHLAARKDQPAVVSALIERGADIKATDYHGRRPLMRAAEAGALSATTALLARKPDLEARSRDGRTALMAAVLARQLATTDALLKAGAAVDARTPAGETALILLASVPFYVDTDPARSAAQIARRLIEAGASRSLQDAKGENALARARRLQYVDMVRALEAP